MPWVKLDDGFADHPKLEQVGPMAAWLHVTAICWCARHLTNGEIPKAKAARLAAVPSPTKRISELVAAGLWHDEDGCYRIHDYLEYQPAREQVEAERAAARNRMTKVREQRSSPEQPANVQENFGDRSPYPDPTRPVPDLDQDQGPPICGPRPVNGTTVAIRDTDFDDFWDAYPAKKGKPAAKAAWAKAIKRATPEEIIAGARRYANDPERNPDHTKYPQGWLNDDRWNDQPTVTRPRMSKSATNLAAWAGRTSS